MKILMIPILIGLSSCASCTRDHCFKYEKIIAIRNCNGIGLCQIKTESGFIDTKLRPVWGYPHCVSH